MESLLQIQTRDPFVDSARRDPLATTLPYWSISMAKLKPHRFKPVTKRPTEPTAASLPGGQPERQCSLLLNKLVYGKSKQTFARLVDGHKQLAGILAGVPEPHHTAALKIILDLEELLQGLLHSVEH